MCTLTYLPGNATDFIFTTNRDESPLRVALEPKIYMHDKKKVLYARDKEANGTWMFCHENDFSVCLLNGAFVKHKHNPPYRKSRGIVVLEYGRYKNTVEFVRNYNFKNIEPFTMLIVRYIENRILEEVRWDGESIHYKEMNADKPHIWSSSTLYTEEAKNKREQWFKDWFNRNEVNQESILYFHKNAGKEDSFNSLVMNRKGLVKTLSITQVIKESINVGMYYEDLERNRCDTILLEKEKSLN